MAEMTSAQPLQNETGPATSIPIGSLEDKLRLAASKGQLDKVQELIQSGASFDPDKNGRTALHYAALNGHLEVCKLLAQKGCRLDDQDVAGCSPLHRAASQGHLEVISFLLGEGCNIDQQDEDGNSPVHEAAWNGFSKTLELLIKHNCNVGVVNKAGFTALHLACQNGHNESTRIILYAGINADLKNNYGDTALHTSARYGHAGVTRILISARSKLNEQNKNGDTALHIAAALKRRKIAKLVVEAGIDVGVKNKQNETAVEVARRKEHPEIIVIITSLNRPKTPTHHHHHHGRVPHKEVNFKEEITIDGPVVVPDEDAPIKSDSKQEKQKKFFFFKKKKKEKDKVPDTKQSNQGKSPQQQQQQQQCAAHSNVQGFFSQYIPRPGVQYYRDLAGNIKQGPIGYTPVCQCLPVIKKLEQKVDANKENIYDHIDASHKILKERLDQLDHRASQQVHAIDQLTRERLQQEERNCQNRINRRLEEENLHIMKHYNESNKFGVNEWLEAKLASYGHCLDHHHDDTALPNNNIFMDVHENANGRLFRSRSDETLSQSDNHSGKFRKKDFYESRQAAMQQMRAWQVPQYNNRERERTRQGQAHIKQTQHYRASPRDISQNERKPTQTIDLQSPSTVTRGQSPNVQNVNDPVYMSKRDYQNQGAIPKRMPHSQTWHNAQEFQSPRQRESSPIVHSTPKSRESSPFDMQASARLVKSNTDGSGLNRFNQMRQSFPERGSANTNTSTTNVTANLSSSAGQGPQQQEQSSTGGKVKPPVPAKPTLKYESKRPSFTTFGYPEKENSTNEGEGVNTNSVKHSNVSGTLPQTPRSSSAVKEENPYNYPPLNSVQASTPRNSQNQNENQGRNLTNRDDMYLSMGPKRMPRQRSQSSDGLLLDDVTSAHEMAKISERQRMQTQQGVRSSSENRSYTPLNENRPGNNYNSSVPVNLRNYQQGPYHKSQNYYHQVQGPFVQGQMSQSVKNQHGQDIPYNGRYTRTPVDSVYSSGKDVRQNTDRGDTKHVYSAVNREIQQKFTDANSKENPYTSAREATLYRSQDNSRDVYKSVDSKYLHSSTNNPGVPYSSTYAINRVGQSENAVNNNEKSLSKSEPNLDRSSDGSEIERNCSMMNNRNIHQNYANYHHVYAKEDSGSNPDSGYSSKIYGNRALTPGSVPSNSGTPSSSFSTDRSISTPSNCSPYTQVSNSDYEVMNPVNKEYQEQVQVHIQNWYQRKVQEAAHRLREGPYNDVQDNGDHYDVFNRYNSHQNRPVVQNQPHQQPNTRPVYMYGQQPQQQYHSNSQSDYQYLPSFVRGTDI